MALFDNTNNYLNNTKEFLESNSLIAKFSFLLLVIFVFIIFFILCIFFEFFSKCFPSQKICGPLLCYLSYCVLFLVIKIIKKINICFFFSNHFIFIL